MTGWNGSNFLFLVGGRRTCGQAQNVAKGPASWAQRSRVVEKENCMTRVHTWYTFTSPILSRMNEDDKVRHLCHTKIEHFKFIASFEFKQS